MTEQGKPDRCPTCGSESPEDCKPAGYNTLNDEIIICWDRWHSSPVPAAAPTHDSTHFCDKHPGWRYPCVQCAKPSAPQAESVPSGKELNFEWDVHHHSAWYKDGKLTMDCGKCGRDLLDEAHLRADETKPMARKRLAETLAASQTAALREQLKSACTQLATHHDLKHDALDKLEAAERSNSLLRERMSAIEKILRENERDGYGYCKNCAQFAPNHDENCWLAILLQNKENQ